MNFRSPTAASGVTSVIFGIVLLVWPKQTLEVFAALLGVGLILVGVTRLVRAAASRDTTDVTGAVVTARSNSSRHRLLGALAGLLLIIAGVVVLANPRGSLRFLLTVAALVWIVAGVSEVVAGIARPRGDRERGTDIAIGVMNVVFGLILLVWPGPTLVFAIWIAAMWAIVTGLIWLFFAWQMNRSLRTP